ncbi:MAG TPA: N-acetylmuramoyl-L-alanine amidase [Anaeromyxobacter sp.]|nr:N-acetylmuramoyl-L-alanine amidase [Anaeromyxobacter sp.]
MAALLRDRSRRRFHHNWDRAIAGLLRAARGEDRAAALYQAARARYALYRWSADEADRDEALRLAGQAAKLGAAEARALALAIHREAGDDRPPPRRRAGQRPPPAADDDEASDPALDGVVTSLAGEAAPAGDSGGEPARISEVKAWSGADYTRVAVYLSRWVGWQRLELPADGDHPRRLALDVKPALLEGRTLERPVGGLRLSRVRAAQYGADTVRVVLDLAGDDRVEVFRLEDPPRLVLDLAAPKAPHPDVAAPREPLPAPAVPSAPAPPVDAGAAEAQQGTAAPQAPAAQPEAAAPPPAPPASADVPDTAVELPPRALALLSGAKPAPAPEAAPPAEPPSSSPEAEGERPIHRIVVDAGHGGHDPGAIGPTRVREKDITLAIALRLARRLREEGFEVVLTRRDDRFLALEERTALANAARGDLFISVHANAHPRRTRVGVETYFLNVTDDRYAARLAARENGAELAAAGDLAHILSDLEAKASAGESLRLARLVQRDVCGGVRARVGEVRDLGVKSALFYVLLGARMPAVLVESGFISNRAEERRLASARYQDEVADGIARAVRTFAGGEANVAAR